MRALSIVTTTAVAVLVLLACLTTGAAADCADPQVLRLQDGNEAVRINLAELEDDDWVRACLGVGGGRRVDWYFTSQRAADDWMSRAQLHYATSNQPYSQPPSVVYHSRLDTSGFNELDFEISDEQAADANERFAVIVHSTGDCLGSGNSCVAEASVGKLGVVPWVIVIVCTVLGVLFCCCCIAGCVYCCRRRSAEQAEAKDVVVVHQQAPAVNDPHAHHHQPKTV